MDILKDGGSARLTPSRHLCIATDGFLSPSERKRFPPSTDRPPWCSRQLHTRSYHSQRIAVRPEPTFRTRCATTATEMVAARAIDAIRVAHALRGSEQIPKVVTQ